MLVDFDLFLVDLEISHAFNNIAFKLMEVNYLETHSHSGEKTCYSLETCWLEFNF